MPTCWAGWPSSTVVKKIHLHRLHVAKSLKTPQLAIQHDVTAPATLFAMLSMNVMMDHVF
jgi:hypothetical protein